MVSPTRVAAPWRLEATEMAMMGETGEMFRRLLTTRATGATIRTVATLSTKAEISPANRDRAMMTHFTLGILSMMWSAIRAGILDLIK